jgi:1,2-diacylglycerol 3-beta-galactosyltransferase
VALLAGGAEGYGHIVEIARCIAGRVSSAQLIIVAGRNKLLRKKLEAVNWEIPTIIFGFVPNMHELMGAADIFITKAGPNSICEAFIAKLPVVLFGYIPCQEEGNVQYVLSHNAGVYVPNSAMIADLFLDWLQPDNSVLTQMACKASSLAHPEAALAIARRAYELRPAL